ELNTLSKRGEWDEMGRLIDDDILNAFAVVGAPHEVPKMLNARFGDLVDRLNFYTPYEGAGGSTIPKMLGALRESGRPE
ncbi:MAG TPA: hypothetical protein VMO88_14945, partial [Acidimicrobiales bacterium]|nr:hypothetical protein [Acidimicrobiales bacterium]